MGAASTGTGGTRKLIALAIGLAAIEIVAGCSASTNTYWYCWDTGDPSPHHIGHPVSGDHLCSDSELAAARSESSTSAHTVPTPPSSPIPHAPPANEMTAQTVPPEATTNAPSPAATTVAAPHQATTPATPTAPAESAAPSIPKAPDSDPVLTGPATASSEGYSVTIRSIKADHDLDIPGYNGPPSLGLALQAACSEPGSSVVVTWKIGARPDPAAESFAACIQGSFNPGGIALTLGVVGCGSHVLTVTPQGFGESIGDTTQHALAAPLRFAVHVC